MSSNRPSCACSLISFVKEILKTAVFSFGDEHAMTTSMSKKLKDLATFTILIRFNQVKIL
jgi:hypothetical protein